MSDPLPYFDPKVAAGSGGSVKKQPPQPGSSFGDILRAFKSGLFMKCPNCKKGKMFKGYFTMRDVCPVCGVRFERENGEYVMAMYINILVTEAFFVTGYLITNYVFELSVWTQIAIWAPFNGLFPVFFYPRSKGLWAGFLYLSGELYRDPDVATLHLN